MVQKMKEVRSPKKVVQDKTIQLSPSQRQSLPRILVSGWGRRRSAWGEEAENLNTTGGVGGGPSSEGPSKKKNLMSRVNPEEPGVKVGRIRGTRTKVSWNSVEKDIWCRLLRIVAQALVPTCPVSRLWPVVSMIWFDQGAWEGIQVKALRLESQLKVSKGRYLV